MSPQIINGGGVVSGDGALRGAVVEGQLVAVALQYAAEDGNLTIDGDVGGEFHDLVSEIMVLFKVFVCCKVAERVPVVDRTDEEMSLVVLGERCGGDEEILFCSTHIPRVCLGCNSKLVVAYIGDGGHWKVCNLRVIRHFRDGSGIFAGIHRLAVAFQGVADVYGITVGIVVGVLQTGEVDRTDLIKGIICTVKLHVEIITEHIAGIGLCALDRAEWLCIVRIFNFREFLDVAGEGGAALCAPSTFYWCKCTVVELGAVAIVDSHVAATGIAVAIAQQASPEVAIFKLNAAINLGHEAGMMDGSARSVEGGEDNIVVNTVFARSVGNETCDTRLGIRRLMDGAVNLDVSYLGILDVAEGGAARFSGL